MIMANPKVDGFVYDDSVYSLPMRRNSARMRTRPSCPSRPEVHRVTIIIYLAQRLDECDIADSRRYNPGAESSCMVGFVDC